MKGLVMRGGIFLPKMTNKNKTFLKKFLFTGRIHMSTDGTKSALAWLTVGTSAVVCLGFAQTAGGRYRRPPSKKPKATDLTTAVDHGNVQGCRWGIPD